MIDMHYFISIFFTVINSFSIFFLFYYLFKKHILPSVKATIKQKKLEKKDLCNQSDRLQEEYINLQHLAAEQLKKEEALTKKLIFWGSQIQEENNIHKEKAHLLEKKIQERAMEQKHNYANFNLLKKAIPAAIEGTTNTLLKDLAQENNSQRILINIINSLNKDMSK